MRHILYVFAYFILTSTLVSNATEVDSEKLVNTLEKQTVLTQKMLRDYCMMGMNITFKNPKENLNKEIEAFDETLTILKPYQQTDKELQSISDMWKRVSIMLKNPVKQENAENLWTQMEILFNALTNKLDVTMKKENAENKLLHTVATLDMLSQRIMALYMLKNWTKVSHDDVLNDTIVKFNDAMVLLEKSSYTNDEIHTKLDKVKHIFFFIQMQLKKTKSTPSLVYRKTSDISKIMHELMQTYSNITKGK